MRDVARIIETRLKLHSPVDTGTLKNSISVTPTKDSVIIEYLDYGVYTNYGTGRYYPGKYSYGTVPDAGSYRGYRKGKGGIRAQYWTSINKSDSSKIVSMIETEVERQSFRYLNQIEL